MNLSGRSLPVYKDMLTIFCLMPATFSLMSAGFIISRSFFSRIAIASGLINCVGLGKPPRRRLSVIDDPSNLMRCLNVLSYWPTVMSGPNHGGLTSSYLRT